VARSVEYLDFTPDALEPVLDQMRAIGQARNGWVNVRPIPLSDESDERLTEFAPTPPVAPVGLFARWRLVLIEGTWVPGQLGRSGAGDASVGLSHPAGRFAVRQLRDAGVPLPDRWKVVVDHARRGLVLTVPDGPPTIAGSASVGPPGGDASAPVDVVLPWLLAAGTVLGPDQITGRWRAEVHRR
jgi:hypothetical protein